MLTVIRIYHTEVNDDNALQVQQMGDSVINFEQLYTSLCWSVSPNKYPLFGLHSYFPGRLKFSMKVKCVCVKVCTCDG